MFTLPSAAEPLLVSFAGCFCEPTFQRFLRLVVGAIVTTGPRTVTNIVWSTRWIMPGHVSDYHRVLSRARWSLWPLGKTLATWVLAWIPENQPVAVAIDDHTDQHRGPRVYGRGCHRDAVRSSHAITVFRWGHRWVVAAVLVKFAFARRPWALPVCCALYRPREVAAQEQRLFKTPPHLARQLMAVLMHWFPHRRFIFLGDGGFSTHDLAWFCHRHRHRATLVFRFYDDAALYAPPPLHQKRGYCRGRPAIRGRMLLRPGKAVARGNLRSTRVPWYGGQQRRVRLLDQAGCWYRSGVGAVSLRWVFVRDAQGTHRDEYLAATDPELSATQILALYTQRWSIEVTFQEMRRHLGLHTPRNWTRASVLRTAPCLLGLFSLISIIFARHLRGRTGGTVSRPWYVKTEPTFSDALSSVRRLLWQTVLLKPLRLRRGRKRTLLCSSQTLLDCLCHAA
jgi:hypothetical protein